MLKTIENYEKIIISMAEEISTLRRENDLEWGEFNEEEYNVENIIKQYLEESE